MSEYQPLTQEEVDGLLAALAGEDSKLPGGKKRMTLWERFGNINSIPNDGEGGAPSLFREAENIINGDRREDYGDAKKSFRHIASLWSAYLNHTVMPADVAVMMALLKLSRLQYSGFTHHDSFVDLLGYIGLAHQISEAE